MRVTTTYAIMAGAIVAGFATPIFLFAAPATPGSKCPDPKGKVIECYDDTTEGAGAFKNDIKAVCVSKGVCQGVGAKDTSGVMQGLQFLNQALGIINGLKNLFQKPPSTPTAPLPPNYYPTIGGGCVNVSDNTRYVHAQAIFWNGCCGSVLSGSVMPICTLADPRSQAMIAACPSVRMLCCDGQWRLATSSDAVCPAPVVGTSGISLEPALNTTKDGAEVTLKENLSEKILKSLFGDNKDGSQPVPKTETLEEMIRKANEVSGTKATSTGNVKSLGQLRKTSAGSTFVVEVQGDGEGVAGFYGADTGANNAARAQSVIGRLCIARPWASKAVSWLISPAFFDSLCARYGYSTGAAPSTIAPNVAVDTTALSREVVERAEAIRGGVIRKKTKGITCNPAIVRAGSPVALEWSCDRSRLVKTAGFKTTSGTTRTLITPQGDAAYGITCEDGFADICRVRVIRPRVAVWTEPAEVRLGSRAVIYWNTEDVIGDSCVVRGPSFLERGASGGAATVAINDTSIYMIECLAADGATTTATTVLDLSL